VIRTGPAELLQGIVEVEKDRALSLVPDHALYPEE
jgi:hypothetical protein